MRIQNVEQLRQEMEKIIDAVTAPDSVPGNIMRANRMNKSEDWDEKGDAERCDQAVADTLEIGEKAIAILTTKKQ
jgi:hypothetical protein